MAQLIGLPNSSGTSMTTLALLSSQSRKSGVTRIEQIRMSAVSKQNSICADMPAGMDAFCEHET